MYRQQPLDDPSMHAARQAVQHLLDRHALARRGVSDRHWNMVLANRMVQPLLEGVDPSLLQAPINLLRVSLHPQGWHCASST